MGYQIAVFSGGFAYCSQNANYDMLGTDNLSSIHKNGICALQKYSGYNARNDVNCVFTEDVPYNVTVVLPHPRVVQRMNDVDNIYSME